MCRRHSAAEQYEEVNDPAHGDAARIEADPIDPVDPSLEVEHVPVRADVHHWLPNSEATVSRSKLTPAGVASSTDTIPTANIPAASLKSRRNASTVAATAKAKPIRLIATARPVSPAFAAAASNELSPLLVVDPPDRSSAVRVVTSAKAAPGKPA